MSDIQELTTLFALSSQKQATAWEQYKSGERKTPFHCPNYRKRLPQPFSFETESESSIPLRMLSELEGAIAIGAKDDDHPWEIWRDRCLPQLATRLACLAEKQTGLSSGHQLTLYLPLKEARERGAVPSLWAYCSDSIRNPDVASPPVYMGEVGCDVAPLIPIDETLLEFAPFLYEGIKWGTQKEVEEMRRVIVGRLT